MPMVTGEEITITQAELAQRAERLGVEMPAGEQTAPQVSAEHVLQFIRESDNQEDLRQIAIQSRDRLREMGVLPPKRNGWFDRFVSRLAVEAVPILLTILVMVPVAAFGVWSVVNGLVKLGIFSATCPAVCDATSLIALAVTSGIAFLLVSWVYVTSRRFFLAARTR